MEAGRNYHVWGELLEGLVEERQMSNLSINSYLNAPTDAVTVNVQFASLPDGTNYPSQTTINAAAKNLTVTTTNSNYQKAQ
jgi:hypothetical protein